FSSRSLHDALPIFAVVGGITAVSGAMVGALLLVAMPQIANDYPSLNNLMILLPGLVGISLARNPDGLVSEARMGARALHRVITERRAAARAAPASRAGS